MARVDHEGEILDVPVQRRRDNDDEHAERAFQLPVIAGKVNALLAKAEKPAARSTPIRPNITRLLRC
jgi:hypothetical protein